MTASTSRRAAASTGGGCLEWGSHCVDLCQWANDADGTAPVEYEPVGDRLHARYANGVKLIMRNDGWLQLGSCPVRFEGETGWVETGDDGELVASNDDLLIGKGAKIVRLPRQLPHPQLPGLRQVARPDPRQRRRRLLVAHRLPRLEHLPVPEPQGQLRPR